MVNPVRQEIDPEFRRRYNVAFDAWQSGEMTFRTAMQELEAMRDEAVAEDNFAHQGAIENTIGIMQGYRANLDASISHFEKARGLYEQANNRELVTSTVLNLGETYRLKGNFTQARRYFHAAYEAAVESNNIPTQSLARTNEGQMLMSMGHREKARATLEDALKLTSQPWNDPRQRESNRLDNICEIHHALATICLEEDDTTAAWEHAKQAFEVAHQLNQALRLGYANRAMAEVITRIGEAPEEGYASDPDTYYKAAVTAFRDLKADGEVARTMFLEAKSLAKRDKKRQAARMFQQVMIVFTRLGMTDDAAKAAEAQLNLL